MLAPSKLQRFFDVFAEMIELRAGAEAIVAELGPSPTGTARLGFYRTLARRSRFIALREVCPVLRDAALSLDPPVWQELVEEYALEHPPDDRDPNRFAERLSDFIAAKRAAGWALPAYLEEIADFEFIEWEVGVVDFEPTLDDPGLERTLRVRLYAHDVPRFVFDHRAGRAGSAPAATPTAAIVYRHAQSGWAHTFFPTPLGLAALARRTGKAVQLPGVSDEALAAAERDLERHGILPARR